MDTNIIGKQPEHEEEDKKKKATAATGNAAESMPEQIEDQSKETKSELQKMLPEGQEKITDLYNKGLLKNQDYSHMDMRGADLQFTIFENCKFDNANLEDANLDSAIFRNCSFRGTNLKGAIKGDAIFKDTDLLDAITA